MSRTAKRAAAGLLGLGAAAAAVLLALAFVPTLFGYEALIVTSGSMGKAMPAGSVAVTRLVDARAIAVGDIVSFRHPGAEEPTTHRVVSLADENGVRVFKTKGDANQTADPEPVPVVGTIHRVENVVPFAGTLVRHARTPAGAVLLFAIPLLGPGG